MIEMERSTRQKFRDLEKLIGAASQFDADEAAISLREVAAAHSARARPRRTNVVFDLMTRGALDLAEWSAAHEIAQIFEMISAGTGARCASYNPDPYEPAEFVPQELREQYRRYTAWRDKVGKEPISGSATLADLVLLVVVDNFEMRAVERYFRMRQGHGAALAALKRGLAAYVVLAD